MSYAAVTATGRSVAAALARVSRVRLPATAIGQVSECRPALFVRQTCELRRDIIAVGHRDAVRQREPCSSLYSTILSISTLLPNFSKTQLHRRIC